MIASIARATLLLSSPLLLLAVIVIIDLCQVANAQNVFSHAACLQAQNESLAASTPMGCWYQPPNCGETNESSPCVSGLEWRLEQDGVRLKLIADLRDLSPGAAQWVAAGFSQDTYMGDDLVVECLSPNAGKGAAYLSFNDATNNIRLHQASEVMLSELSTKLHDGFFECDVKLLLDNADLIQQSERQYYLGVEDHPYHLLMARGEANPYTFEKYIHGTNDDAKFPWTSRQRVVLCRPDRNNCSSLVEAGDIRSNRPDGEVLLAPGYGTLVDAYQTTVSRYARYRIAVSHGSILLFAWWVLGSSGILLARYFKPAWPKRRLFGTAVWFQLHRDAMILSVVLQIVLVVLIFYQSGWRLYFLECSRECGSGEYAKQMHAILGVAATVLAVLQPLVALLRPSPDAGTRPIFNWIHWVLGMTAFLLASAAILFAFPLGKTGLERVFGHRPALIAGGYLAFFFFCNVVLEILTSGAPRRSTKIGPSGMDLAVLHGPATEAPTGSRRLIPARLFIFGLHLLVSLGVVITLTVMLVQVLWSHSP